MYNNSVRFMNVFISCILLFECKGQCKFGIYSGSIFVQNSVNTLNLVVTYMLQINCGIIGKRKANKKAKAEPTREEMHAVVVDILKQVDFNTVSYDGYFPLFPEILIKVM